MSPETTTPQQDSPQPPRVRVASIVVQVQAFTDDGEHLTPLQVQPLTIPAAQWEEFATSGVAGIEQQIEAARDAGAGAP